MHRNTAFFLISNSNVQQARLDRFPAQHLLAKAGALALTTGLMPGEQRQPVGHLLHLDQISGFKPCWTGGSVQKGLATPFWYQKAPTRRSRADT